MTFHLVLAARAGLMATLILLAASGAHAQGHTAAAPAAMTVTKRTVHLMAVVRVAAANQPAFDRLHQKMQAVVATEGPARVLVYERYARVGSDEYFLYEAFADEAAFTAHLALTAPVGAAYPVPMTMVHYELCGPVSPETVALLTGAYGDQFTHYSVRR